MGRRTASSGRVWEEETGYSRAVRVGPLIEVSSTCASLPDGTIVHTGDLRGQLRHIFGIIEESLAELDATLADIVSVSYYIRDQERWPEVGEIHRELFLESRPALSYIFTSGWPLEGVDVEVVCTAYVE